MKKLVDIDLTGQCAQSFPDPEIEGWQWNRIEYGGCNKDCYYEGSIWFPPHVDSDMFCKIFEIMQVPEANKKLEESVKKIHKEDIGELSNWRTLGENGRKIT